MELTNLTAPRLSVVLPSYNHANFVGEAITSVLTQSFRDLELVVIDDGSSDGSVVAIRGFDDPRLRFIARSDNIGYSNTLNEALALARGDYVALLCSDDVFLPGKLERQVAVLDANPGVAAVFGRPAFIGRSGGDDDIEENPFEAAFSAVLVDRFACLRHFFFHGNALCHPTALLRRTVFEDVGGYEPTLIQLQDFDFWVRLCARHEIRVLDEALTAYRLLGPDGNASWPTPSKLRRTAWEERRVLRRFANFDEALLRRVFAVELAQLQLPEPIGPRAMLARVLAELGQGRGRALMALEWLEQAVAEAEPGANAALLADLSGRLDPLGIGNEVPSPPKRPDPVRPPEWEYVGDDWPDTDGRRDGWEHPSVLATQLSKWHGFAVTLASTLPLGVYHEAPVITHDNPAAHNFIMTFGYVLARAAAGRRKLSVLDWGGGLGHYAALAGAMLPEVELEFTTFDLPLFTQAGRDHQVGVRFSADAEHCLARRYDLIFASGSLQYERDWVQLLRRFAASSSAWVFLTRTPFVDDVPGFVVVQRPFSTEGYQTEYLSQVFNRQSLLREAADCGLRIDREFMMIGEHVVAKGAPAGFGYRGFLFAVDHAVQDGFDEAYYLRRYPDVARAVLLEGLPSGRHHYEHHGRGEGRLPTAVGERERA